MRIGYVWFPHLSVQVATLRDPALRGRPLVIGGDQTGRGRVVDASDDCLAAGVTSGMALREAIELVPAATFLPVDPNGDADMFARALDLLDRFAEAIEENGRQGAWFVPAGLPSHPPAPCVSEARRLGATIVDSIAAALGLSSRVGIGAGKFIARVAAERAPVGGVEVVATEYSAAYLAPLPVTLLPLSPRSIERLKLLGVSTIGDFAHLPSDALPRRFGPEAGLAWRIAHGDDDALLIPRRRPETWSARQTFEPPIEDRTLILTASRALLDRLCRPLQDRGRAFRTLWITIGLEDGRVLDQHADLRTPTSDPRRCLPVLQSMVEALTLERSAAYVAVRIEAIRHEPANQGELFDRTRAERRERIAQTLSEIARRYRGRLRRVVPGDNPSSLFVDRRLLLLPYEPDVGRGSVSHHLAEPATRIRPIRLIVRDGRIYLAGPSARSETRPVSWQATGAWENDEIVALHARWEADDWWPDTTRWTYYRVRTRRGLIATLARDHDQQRWFLIENFD